MARLRQTERERRRGDETVETVASTFVADRDLAGVQAVENFHLDVRNEHWRSRPGEDDVAPQCVGRLAQLEGRARKEFIVVRVMMCAVWRGSLPPQPQTTMSIRGFDEEDETELLDAIRVGITDLEERDPHNRTPLMAAIESGSTNLVRTLISMGANVNAKSDDGQHCLSLAIERGKFEVVELLVEAGADIESESSNFNTPLRLAAIRGNVQVVEFLLDEGAALETGGEMKETALMEACYFGHADVVEALLKRGASVMARNAFGDSVMDVANKTKNSRIIELLKNRQ